MSNDEGKATKGAQARATPGHDPLAELLRLACDVLPAGIGVVTPDQRLAYANPALAHMGGHDSVASACGKTPREAVPEIAELLEGIYHRVLVHGEPVTDLQIAGRTGPDGQKEGEWVASYLPLRAPSTGQAGGAEPVVGIGVLVLDVEAQRRAERTLRQHEEQFRRLADLAPVGIALLGAAGDTIYINGAGLRIVGRGELSNRDSWFTAVAVEDRARLEAEVLAAHRAERGVDTLAHFRHADGTLTAARVRTNRIVEGGRLAGHVMVLEDITERLRLEEQMARARRMESIGRLAGGVAHDFNNLLTIILSTSVFLREAARDHDDAQLADDVAAVVDAADRARALTRQLLTFARRQMGSLRPVSLAPMVARLGGLLRRVISESIELTVSSSLAPDASVLGDESQLEQLVMNLALNARDAMPAGGQLVLYTEEILLDEGAEEVVQGVGPGAWLVLSVRDTGIGMSAEVMSHLFEPFFTTKALGHGNGMGLATCYGIVQQMGGQITCESAPGEGSVFRCYLPRYQGVPDEAQPPAEADGDKRRGGEALLLVEDEPTVRHVAARALRELGYRVVTAQHGAEALTLVEVAKPPFALVVTDLVMPVMGGRELATRLRERWPELPVLFTSGHVADHPERMQDIDPRRFLAKPYLPGELARRVRELLDG